MPITTSSFLSINAEFAASTASNAQLSLQDTAIAAQVYPTGGGRIFGPIDFSTIQSVSTTTVYDGAANFGWATGGFTANTSRIDRIDFGNDTVTASARGGLSGARYGHSSTGNTNYGYATGGQGGASTSVLDRIDYANDSPTASITRGTLAVARGGAGGVSTQNFGWFGGGGIITPATNFSTVDRIDYSNDSAAASSRGSLTIAKWRTGAAGNNNYGWFAGGGGSPTNSNPAIISTVDRIEFNNDTVTPSLRTTLPMPRYGMGASGNSNYGWWGGGGVPGPTVVSLVHRIDYANDSPTTASPRGPLTAARYMIGASGNANYGWFTGGAPNTSIVDRIDFSNDTTTASPRGPLSISRGYTANTSNYVKSEKGVLLAAKIPFTEVWSINTYTNQSTWIEISGTYGWFAGGWTPGASAVVDRIDFANDSPTTASPRGALSQGRTQIGSGNNSNYGWFFGGYVPGAVSTVDRIDFGNDSPTSAIARNSLPAVTGQYPVGMPNGYSYLWMTSSNSIVLRLDFSNDGVAQASRGTYSPSQGQQGGSNQFYGWITGGKPSSRVERIDFSNDSPTAASTRGPLLATRGDGTFSGNQNYGWVITGYPGTGPLTGISSVERIDYSNDSPTSPSPRGNIPVSARTQKSSGNANYGWIGGGAPTLSSVYRIDYANDTASATTRGPITVAREMGASVSNYVIGRSQPAGTTTSTGYAPNPYNIYTTATTTPIVVNGNYGWWAGGIPDSASTLITSTSERVDFSSDTATASPRGLLSTARYSLAAAGNANYGWYAGGINRTLTTISSVDSINFANDSPAAASPRGVLSVARQGMAAVSNNNYGWFGGGQTTQPAITSAVDRIDFANDGVASVRGQLALPAGAIGLAATGNANYAWFGGGGNVATISTVSRIDYSNDSPTTASPRGPLSQGRMYFAATGNANYGWFGGGYDLTLVNYSTIDRITYSNDTATATARTPLPLVIQNNSATGNANYGWFGGGYGAGVVYYTIVYRIDFSNDTASVSTRGSLNLKRFSSAAVSNTAKDNLTFSAITGNIGTYGWWAGGEVTAPGTDLSTVDRIDFSNDSPSAASPRGGLTLPRWAAASTGNANYGWHGGGQPQTGNVERTDFANDTSANSPRGSLPNGHYQHAAVGNANYAWHVGGAPIVTGSTSVDRINYSNDTASASTRSQVAGISALAATGTANYGWFGGGRAAPAFNNTSVVNRIDYSNDSPSSASPRGPLSLDRYYLAGMGNNNYGWFAGGYAPIRSTVDRIDYSNDSNAAVTRGPLTAALTKVTAAGNSNYGWLGGGDSNGFYTSTSVVYRIDYSNDSSTSQQRGPKSLARFWDSASSNYVQSRTEILASSPVNWTGGKWIKGGLSIA
jgi:hypothetical protein